MRIPTCVGKDAVAGVVAAFHGEAAADAVLEDGADVFLQFRGYGGCPAAVCIDVLVTYPCGVGGQMALVRHIRIEAVERTAVGGYFNMQRLLERLDLERLQGHAITFLDRLAKTDLLILDDFGMKKLQGQQQNDFEQLVDDRYRKKGLIITSQLPVKDWYDVIGNPLIAEACLDRLVHKSTRIQLNGESLRKKY